MSKRLCLFCGQPNSSTRSAYCSDECRKKAWHRRTECAANNEGLECSTGDCNRCGWNPEVAQERMEALGVTVE
jgi:hypothetical protein